MFPQALQAIDSRWEKAVSFFKKRGHVLFVSDRYRFWESPGFVQQSLAKTLIESGVKVSWLDGMSWKRLSPSVSFSSPLLKVEQLNCLPGRRLPWVDRLSTVWQAKQIQSLQKKDDPLVWIQGGLDERICAKLSHIDVFSAFDDAYLHTSGDVLTERAKIIVSQNQFCHSIYESRYPQKAILSLPPVDLNPSHFTENLENDWLRKDFPQTVVGYLGACFSEGYDFDLLEYLIQKMPEWGFLIVGRTDTSGLEKINWLRKYSNFAYHEHVPRQKLASIWKTLSLNLMLYRTCRANSGAFPVKVLEAAYFDVPSVATETPKTSGLKNWISCSSEKEELLALAQKAISIKKDQKEMFESLFYEMHPKVHLAKIAEALR